jgi:hypothetical protein
MECRKVLGEKCPACGSENLRTITDLLPSERKRLIEKYGMNTGVEWMCCNPLCGVTIFPEGAGGRSHGLCSSCVEQIGERNDAADPADGLRILPVDGAA